MKHEVHEMMVKVPQITLVFWVAKLLTTAFGESFSDFLFFGDVFTHGETFILGVSALIILLIIQLSTRKYIPWIYWLTVAAVAVFGTMSADFLSVVFHVPFVVSTLTFAVLQIIVFIVWFTIEKNLDISKATTHRREIFYWLTVILTFTLGTALGDFTARTLHWGTLVSTGIFLIVILVPAIGFKWLRFNRIFAFWFAYTLTRPLGASFADWLGIPAPYGDGLHLGTGRVSVGIGILMLTAFIVIDYKHRKTKGTAAGRN